MNFLTIILGVSVFFSFGFGAGYVYLTEKELQRIRGRIFKELFEIKEELRRLSDK